MTRNMTNTTTRLGDSTALRLNDNGSADLLSGATRLHLTKGELAALRRTLAGASA